MQVKSNGLTTMQRTEDVVGLDLERRRDKMVGPRQARKEVQLTRVCRVNLR